MSLHKPGSITRSNSSFGACKLPSVKSLILASASLCTVNAIFMIHAESDADKKRAGLSAHVGNQLDR
jgi:hypothetical protein